MSNPHIKQKGSQAQQCGSGICMRVFNLNKEVNENANCK